MAGTHDGANHRRTGGCARPPASVPFVADEPTLWDLETFPVTFASEWRVCGHRYVCHQDDLGQGGTWRRSDDPAELGHKECRVDSLRALAQARRCDAHGGGDGGACGEGPVVCLRAGTTPSGTPRTVCTGEHNDAALPLPGVVEAGWTCLPRADHPTRATHERVASDEFGGAAEGFYVFVARDDAP